MFILFYVGFRLGVAFGIEYTRWEILNN